MRSLSIVSVAALLVLGSRPMHAQASGAAHAGHAQPTRPSDTLTALLTDPLGSRAASGTATVTGTTVRIAWDGDKAGSVRTWSVRRGTCVRDEGVLGAVGAYAPITVNGSGSGTGSATLGAPLANDARYHVVIHGSDNAATALPFACGALGAWVLPPKGDTVLTSSPNGSRPAPVDHSTMNHAEMAMPRDSAPGAPPPALSDSTLMAIYVRMMADPVIRERVRTDPVLQQMLAGVPALPSMPTDIPAAEKDSTRAETPATGARRTTTSRPAAKPTAKPTPKPTHNMPGMDHSKMPVKRKPPV